MEKQPVGLRTRQGKEGVALRTRSRKLKKELLNNKMVKKTINKIKYIERKPKQLEYQHRPEIKKRIKEYSRKNYEKRMYRKMLLQEIPNNPLAIADEEKPIVFEKLSRFTVFAKSYQTGNYVQTEAEAKRIIKAAARTGDKVAKAFLKAKDEQAKSYPKAKKLDNDDDDGVLIVNRGGKDSFVLFEEDKTWFKIVNRNNII
jgi:hypothetical protein